MSGTFRVLVVGAGLSGLTAAALLAQRGLDVTVVEMQDRPGGAASSFRRGDVTYDTGAAMLFGFGQKGFNPHHWLMSQLEEPVEMYRHESMYRLFYGDVPIVFHAETENFLQELSKLFPEAQDELRAFYRHIGILYEKVIAPVTVFEAPGDMPLSEMRKNATNGLGAQLEMIRMLFSSADSMARPFISDPRVRAFFDKLTSTYCYTTLRETPAVLAATMFVDNHVGGAFYPAGSVMALAGRLEKAVEKFGGRFRYRTRMLRLSGDGKRIRGIVTPGGETIEADAVLFSGSLRSFARSLDPENLLPARWKRKIMSLDMTMPSFVVYGTVRKSCLPPETLPVQMFVDNIEALDEADVTLYLPSLEDPSLAPPELSTFLLIGPSLRKWPEPGDPGHGTEEYRRAKQVEADRMLGCVERRLPGFIEAIETRIEASPTTIWRYLGKEGGSVAGPKQKMGQHLIFRQGSKGPVPGLFFAGESTVMGTGTPAVTVSGISAANRILRGLGLEAYTSDRKKAPVVKHIPKGTAGNLPSSVQGVLAARCRWCEEPACAKACPAHFDIPGIMRRCEVGNLEGARRIQEAVPGACAACAAGRGTENPPCEMSCILRSCGKGAVEIRNIVSSLSVK
jgi:prolycopene isomerase